MPHILLLIGRFLFVLFRKGINEYVNFEDINEIDQERQYACASRGIIRQTIVCKERLKVLITTKQRKFRFEFG